MKYFIDPDIRKAETLPGSFYQSEEVFNQIKEKIFAKSWQWVGDSHSLLPLTDYAHPINLLDHYLDEPVLLTRDTNQHINAQSNICTHRANILIHQPGKMKKLTCMYHGRRFAMDGKMEYMPEFKEVENFPRACDHLHQFAVKNWFEHLFVGLDPTFDLGNTLDVMSRKVGFLNLDRFKRDAATSKDYLVNCHWALYCDNYLEGFHIPFVHKDLNAILDYESYTTELYDHMNLQIGYATGADQPFDLPKDHEDYGKQIAAYYFWLFPNMMFNFYPWGLSVNVVKPISPNKTRVSFITYLPGDQEMSTSAQVLMDKVEREDEFVVEGVHRGLKSRFYQTGRFSPTKEKGVHHFQSLLCKFLED